MRLRAAPRRRRRRWPAVLLALATWAPVPASALAGEVAGRSRELLRLECATPSLREDTTLFANGTLRLLRGRPPAEEMLLAELGPDEVRALEGRLEREELDRMDPLEPPVVTGGSVPVCELALQRRGEEARRWRFTRMDVLPLRLSRILQVADELSARVAAEGGRSRLPVDYEPRRGDLLRHRDGGLFEVVGETTDGLGVELTGRDRPLTVYVPRDDLPRLFVALEGGRRR